MIDSTHFLKLFIDLAMLINHFIWHLVKKKKKKKRREKGPAER